MKHNSYYKLAPSMVRTSTIVAVSSAATDEAAVTISPRPPLKWAGGKRWLLPHLVEVWRPENHRRLVEPFSGGLAVTLGLMPRRALLNDSNPHLINFYRWLKKGLTLTLPMKNAETFFYTHRKRFNDLLSTGKADTAEAASLFYYLNRTGYNGLCRFNSTGGFNVPFGKYKSINYRADFLDYKPIFAEWELANTHFKELHLEHDDFIYADPPYDVEFTQYSQGGFDWEEQVTTAEWLSKHKGGVGYSLEPGDAPHSEALSIAEVQAEVYRCSASD